MQLFTAKVLRPFTDNWGLLPDDCLDRDWAYVDRRTGETISQEHAARYSGRYREHLRAKGLVAFEPMSECPTCKRPIG